MIIESDNGCTGALSSVKNFTNILTYGGDPRELGMQGEPWLPPSQHGKALNYSLHGSLWPHHVWKEDSGQGGWSKIPVTTGIWLVSWGHLVISDLKKIGPNTESLSSQGSGFSLTYNSIFSHCNRIPMTVYKTLWIWRGGLNQGMWATQEIMWKDNIRTSVLLYKNKKLNYVKILY